MLTVKQEKFIQNIVKGKSQREAYKDAYNATYKDSSIDSKASTLFNSEKVQARYKELMQELEQETIMSAKERMEWLTGIIKNKENDKVYIKAKKGKIKLKEVVPDLSTRMRALDILNKMTGEYKTILDGSVELEEKLEDLI